MQLSPSIPLCFLSILFLLCPSVAHTLQTIPRDSDTDPKLRPDSANHSHIVLSTNSDQAASRSLSPISSNQTSNNSDSLYSNDSDSIPTTTAHVDRIYHLINLNAQLERALHIHRHNNFRANKSLQTSKSREQLIRSQRNQLFQSRKKVQNQLELLRPRLLRYDATLKVLREQVSLAIRDIERLRTKKFWLLQYLNKLDDDLREKGLERWVGGAVKGTLNPLVADALVQSTASIVEPVLESLERFAQVEGKWENVMKGRLRTRVPLVDRPFYSGFVTYAVLLCPLVLVLSVVSRVRRSLAKIGVIHILVLANFYFMVLCAGCFCATVVGKVDVLFTLRTMNRRVFDAVMLLHGAMFLPHVVLHAIVAIRARSLPAVSRVAALTVIGLHYFVHMWRHAVRHEDPHVDRYAYLLYTAVFGFLFYELVTKRIQKGQDRQTMTLNNTSIMIDPKDTNVSSGDAIHSTGATSSVTKVTLLKRDAASVKNNTRTSQSPPPGLVNTEGRPWISAVSETSTMVVVDRALPAEHVMIDTNDVRSL